MNNLMMPLVILINSLFLIVLYFFIKFSVKEFLNVHKRDILYKNYPTIMAIFDNAKQLAYKKIYQETILVSSSSGVRIGKEEIFNLQKNYVKLVLKLAGDEIMKDLINIHGDLRTILLNLGNGFVIRVNEDESSIIDIVKDKITSDFDSKGV